MQRRFTSILRMAMTAIFICLYIVLNRFVSFYIPLGGLPSVRIGVSSVPVLLCSLCCGPLWGLVCGAGGDVIAAFAFPNGTGAYLYGYTIDAALLGLIPWLIAWIFKKRKASLVLFDALCALAALIVFYALILPYDDSSYRIPLDYQGKLWLGLALVVLMLISVLITLWLYQKGKSDSQNLHKETRNYLQYLDSLNLSDSQKRNKLREAAKRLKALDISFSYSIGLLSLSLSEIIGKELYKLSFEFKIPTGKNIQSCTKTPYSFLTVYSILLFEGIFVKTLLLAYWSNLYYGIPYSYAVFTNLLTNIVSLPILALIAWACYFLMAKVGFIDKLKYRKVGYKTRKN